MGPRLCAQPRTAGAHGLRAALWLVFGKSDYDDQCSRFNVWVARSVFGDPSTAGQVAYWFRATWH
eukprot:1221948-Lingulodinium_polyedra.AAC.1